MYLNTYRYKQLVFDARPNNIHLYFTFTSTCLNQKLKLAISIRTRFHSEYTKLSTLLHAICYFSNGEKIYTEESLGTGTDIGAAVLIKKNIESKLKLYTVTSVVILKAIHLVHKFHLS